MTILQYGKVTPFQWLTRGFKCFYCDKPMPDSDTLKEHTNNKHFMTDLLSFLPKRIKTRYIPIKLDVTDIACVVCEEPVDGLEGLINHVETVHDETYDHSYGVCAFPFLLSNDKVNPCAICEASFDNLHCLVSHMYKEHIANSHMCQICGLRFMDSVRLKRHFKSSHIGCRCKICNIMFDGYHKLIRHKEMVHGDVRSFVCNLCSEKFRNYYQLKVHMGKVHNVSKYRIKCKFCPKICTTKGAMLLHVQSLHSEPRFECDMCDYKTAIKWMIKLHKRKHFGEKNYACSICSRHFGRSSNLRAHMKVHTGNFGRVCRWCRKGFPDTKTFEAHEKESFCLSNSIHSSSF